MDTPSPPKRTRHPLISVTCQVCSVEFLVIILRRSTAKYCSNLCFKKAREHKKETDLATGDIEFLRQHIKYDPVTGLLTWIKSPGYRAKVGSVAGYKHGSENSYVHVNLYSIGLRETAHRIAWALHYGEWPKREIDHENRIRHDNRISNLRLADRSQNSYNQPTRGKSGHKGIFKKGNRYRATITSNYKTIYIGTYDTIEEAIKARKAKEIELGVAEFVRD